MPSETADRLLWAVEMLDIQREDRLLEIGCGHGIAVTLICECLGSGTITAIDRSDTMIRMATKRNHVCVESGKARFQTASLESADLGDDRFSKIFAVNVNLFSKQPAKPLTILREHLTPHGALYLFQQPPVERKTREYAEQVTDLLQAHQFSVRETVFKDIKPVLAVCIIAVPV